MVSSKKGSFTAQYCENVCLLISWPIVETYWFINDRYRWCPSALHFNSKNGGIKILETLDLQNQMQSNSSRKKVIWSTIIFFYILGLILPRQNKVNYVLNIEFIWRPHFCSTASHLTTKILWTNFLHMTYFTFALINASISDMFWPLVLIHYFFA